MVATNLRVLVVSFQGGLNRGDCRRHGAVSQTRTLAAFEKISPIIATCPLFSALSSWLIHIASIHTGVSMSASEHRVDLKAVSAVSGTLKTSSTILLEGGFWPQQ